MSGIYIVTNLVNGKIYIGLTNNFKRRWSEHKTPKQCSKKTVLAKAFRKYGVGNMQFDVLERCKIAALESREVFWIKMLDPEYNMNEGGLGNSRVVKESTKIKLRKAGKLQWANMTKDQRDKIVRNNLANRKRGFKMSAATKLKLRNHNLGKKQSKETKAKRSAKMKKSMLNNSNGNKTVLQIKDGVVIERFDSCVLAAKSLGINPSGISATINGRQKSSGGFRWKYLK